jgi:hypothetical protein
MTEQISASLAIIANNLISTSGLSLAIFVGLGLIAGGLLSTIGSRVTRLSTMNASAKEQADFGYLLPLGKCWNCGNKLPLWQQMPLLFLRNFMALSAHRRLDSISAFSVHATLGRIENRFRVFCFF